MAEAEPIFRRASLIQLNSSKASGHWLPNTTSVLRNYAGALVEAGSKGDDTIAVIANLMTQAGFDPATLLRRVFGDEDNDAKSVAAL